MATINDRKAQFDTDSDDVADYYEAAVMTATDYFPFGAPMRQYQSTDYRYGFNGKETEHDGEFAATVHYDYGFRVYHPAVGRFLSVDPRAEKYHGWSPYNYVLGNPIRNIDTKGDTVRVTGNSGTYDWTPGTSYSGPEDGFVENTFLALNTLVNGGVGRLGFPDPSGNIIIGNVITDFVGEGRFSANTISISEINDGNTQYGAGIISFDPTAGVIINPTEGHEGGKRAPMIALLHEFGHAWLDNVNSVLKEVWKGSFYMPGNGMKAWKYNDSREHFHLLEFLENPASIILGQATRALYRGTHWSDEAGQSATNPSNRPQKYKSYDLYYRTVNSTSTESKN